ncbi:MAG TPA: dienelactone hydrolase family protein [Sphingobium sp.]
MGSIISLTAQDGHILTAYEAKPSSGDGRALVLIQEIFGINSHIRAVADDYAANGYHVIAPSLFDRIEQNIQFGYDEASIGKGLELMQKTSFEMALADIAAAQAALPDGKRGVIGYCWGGTLSWLSATRLSGFSAAAVYYGGGIGNFASEDPSCPVIAHFGTNDEMIPVAEAEKLGDLHADEVELHLYPATHGFNCDERGSFDPESAKLAKTRTLAFFDKHLG